MSRQVADLIYELEPDAFRASVPFEASVAETTAALIASVDSEASSDPLSKWLGKYQPCLFGRITAR